MKIDAFMSEPPLETGTPFDDIGVPRRLDAAAIVLRNEAAMNSS
jgi:hypothetical protein